MTDHHFATATELTRAYASGEITPVDIAGMMLARIEALDASVNAYCHLDPETTMAMAEASAERWANGAPLSPLDGVPVAIKDLLVTRGWPTLRGSLTVDRTQAWSDDAPSVARLRAAGCVFTGKVTTPEFGWKATNDSPLTGITRNPWNLSKTPGGSSGGSAAAIAAGLATLAIGTDAGGSIRIPASFCNVFGFKPSFGRIAAWPLSPFGTLAHVGPMARNVEDAALFLDVMAGPDTRDWYSLPRESLTYADGLNSGIKGARIAYSATLGYARVDPEVAELCAAAARAFEALGAHVEAIDPLTDDPLPAFKPLYYGAAHLLLGRLPPEKKAQLEPALAALAEEGSRLTLDDYLAAQQARAALGIRMRQFMERFDYLLTPQLAVPAFDVGLIAPKSHADMPYWTGWTAFTYPFNLTQQPAATINCGFTQAGLPVGIQIVGRNFEDHAVLRAAFAYETAHPNWQRHPKDF